LSRIYGLDKTMKIAIIVCLALYLCLVAQAQFLGGFEAEDVYNSAPWQKTREFVKNFGLIPSNPVFPWLP